MVAGKIAGRREWHYIIVGGGTSGCVLAARLTENPGTSVLLLEAGGEYSAAGLSVPLPGMRLTAEYSWKYFTRQQAGLAYRRISFPMGRILGAIDYGLRRKGVMSSNCCECGAMVRSIPEADMPDLQFVTHFQSHLYPKTVDLQICLLHTLSRGSLMLASADPHIPPIIDPNYELPPADTRLACFGIRLARKIAQAPALRRFPLGEEVLPGADLISDRELEFYCRSMGETCYHPVGTCRMGHDDLAVVDPEPRVRGLEALRVVEVSMKLISTHQSRTSN